MEWLIFIFISRAEKLFQLKRCSEIIVICNKGKI